MSIKFKTIQTAPVRDFGEINHGKSEVDTTCIFRDITALIPQLVRYRDYAEDYYLESVNDYDDGDYDDFDDDLTSIDLLQEQKQKVKVEKTQTDNSKKDIIQKTAVNEVERADVADNKSE